MACEGSSIRRQKCTKGGTKTPEKPGETNLKCSVCLDLYEIPLLLPCLHTYCKKCVEGILRKSIDKTQKTLSCPQCRKDHVLPEGGVCSFPSDQVLANEVQAHALKTVVKSSSDMKQKQCTMCTEDDPPTSYCASCGKYLCDFCHKAHKRQVDFRSHKVTPLSELGPEDILTMEKPLHCQLHTGEVIKLYCKTCNKLICRDCTIVDHRAHEYGFISNLRPLVQQEVRKISTALQQRKQHFVCHKALILTAEKEYEEYSTDLEYDITTTFNGYIKQMEAHRNKLLQQVQTSKQADMKQIWAQKQFIETTLTGIESALCYADRLCGCSSDTVMLAMRSEATAQFDSLQSSQWDTTKLKLSTPHLFQKTSPQIEASGRLNEVSNQHVSISVFQKGSVLPKHNGYYFGHEYQQSYHTISLGEKVLLTVKADYVPFFSSSVSITMKSNYTREIQEFKSFTCSYVKKGEWTLEILPTRSGECVVHSNVGGAVVYTVQVKGPLKVGSRVRRGPNWNSGDEDGGDGGEGTVTSNTAQQSDLNSYFNHWSSRNTQGTQVSDMGVCERECYMLVCAHVYVTDVHPCTNIVFIRLYCVCQVEQE